MTAPTPTPYDLYGPLPSGTTLLEASAGTGKTFTIAALATRLVAEGAADLTEILCVTFSRAATAELRERVRGQFLSAHRKLAGPAGARGDRDDVGSFLAEADDAEVAERRSRLGRALSAFDAATIVTTHGFCQQMLTGLGIAAAATGVSTLLERPDDLVTEVVDDFYLRKYAHHPEPGVPVLDYACVRKIAAKAVEDPFSTLAPADAATGTEAGLRYGLAHAVRSEVARRKRQRHLFDYDDLLSRLHAALTDTHTGLAACERLRTRYRYVLVDEFQDTDPVQWEILRTAFLGHTTLVLIGDPKQAIYAFRGADVFAYLSAADEATTHHTLSRNWRSDEELLQALQRVYGDAALGDERIVVRPVESAHPARRLTGAPVDAPLRLRVVPRSLFGAAVDSSVGVDLARQAVSRDVAADIAALLRSGASLTVDDGVSRPIRAGQVAVLVHRHKDAATIREDLRALGVPAVLAGAKSVFLTAPAAEWLSFLRALEQPHRPGLVRAAALTPFGDWSAARLSTAGDQEVDEFGDRLRSWRDLLAERGVAALLEVVTDSQDLTERLLARIDGGRYLTDLRHIGQALHAAARREDLGPAALVQWLQRQMSDAERDQSQEGSRRLESDADAVQIATIYVSKGLEFPIVYVPFGWDRHVEATPDPLRYHDPCGQRVLFVGGEKGPGYDSVRQRHLAENAGEALRLLYVALTRAQCQVVTWWAPTARNTPGSALHRLLFGERAKGQQPPQLVPVPADADVRKRLAHWAAGGRGVSVEEVGGPSAERWSPPAPSGANLDAASFSRSLDVDWRRTSYSSLTAAAHDAGTAAAGVASEPEQEERRDEPLADGGTDAPVAAEEAPLRAVPSPMADLPSGAAFGTLVHSVLETIDTTTDDLANALRERCSEVLSDRLDTDVTADELAAGLLPALRTPLGPLAFGRSLATIPPADRLSELAFELPLLGGDEPRSQTATLNAVADLLRQHLSAGDPLAGYADLLADPLLGGQTLRGYLGGSVDVVLRLRDGAGTPRYLVVDYKTNWLGGFGPDGRLPLTAWDYRPAALTSAMLHAHYPLQALLYSVAVHRYLRWRQPEYDPAVHLGGVLYLFVRGMCGASTPVVGGVATGVFSWRPPDGLVEDLSRLLDQGGKRRSR